MSDRLGVSPEKDLRGFHCRKIDVSEHPEQHLAVIGRTVGHVRNSQESGCEGFDECSSGMRELKNVITGLHD